MKIYSAASEEVERTIKRMLHEYHPDLTGVTIASLFIYDPENTERQVLQHGGYPAAAVVRITPTIQRALGIADAVIVIDRALWLNIKGARCDALIDHELYHLERMNDEDTNQPLVDSLGRPRLEMRKHDRQFGWFDEIAQRHGDNSMEVIQARSILSETQQLYFDFATSKIKPAQQIPLADIAGAREVSTTETENKPDELLEEAIAYVRESQKPSCSAVQLKFGIGYNRAARLMEAMEMRGIVSPLPPGGRREILPVQPTH